jgi:hypothetical protein
MDLPHHETDVANESFQRLGKNAAVSHNEQAVRLVREIGSEPDSRWTRRLLSGVLEEFERVM